MRQEITYDRTTLGRGRAIDTCGNT